mmetsp:Transcript_13852/g.43874  ORF Transcript_13852/g.43874 Transcript_13852/m.43874 type:complete len:283 (+) Transcript_13852:637-1485(+)
MPRQQQHERVLAHIQQLGHEINHLPRIGVDHGSELERGLLREGVPLVTRRLHQLLFRPGFADQHGAAHVHQAVLRKITDLAVGGEHEEVDAHLVDEVLDGVHGAGHVLNCQHPLVCLLAAVGGLKQVEHCKSIRVVLLVEHAGHGDEVEEIALRPQQPLYHPQSIHRGFVVHAADGYAHARHDVDRSELVHCGGGDVAEAGVGRELLVGIHRPDIREQGHDVLGPLQVPILNLVPMRAHHHLHGPANEVADLEVRVHVLPSTGDLRLGIVEALRLVFRHGGV